MIFMKKAICFLLAAILMCAVFGCAGREPVSPAPEEGKIPEPTDQAAATEEPTEEPAPLSLLPDWPTENAESEWVTYRGVSADMLGEYIESREADGFGLMLNADTDLLKILVRGDAWIEIADNTGEDSSCEIKVSFDSPTEGVDRGEVEEAIAEAEYSWADPEGPEGGIDTMIEITPEGLYEGTGLVVFRVLYDERAEEGTLFTTRTFIVGAGKAFEVRYFDIAAGDIDGDGEADAVFLCPGPLSGFYSIIFEAFGIKNGELERIGISGYSLVFGQSGLSAHDGRVFYTHAERADTGEKDEASFGEEKEFALYVEYGEILIEDPENLLALGLLAHFN